MLVVWTHSWVFPVLCSAHVEQDSTIHSTLSAIQKLPDQAAAPLCQLKLREHAQATQSGSVSLANQGAERGLS